MGLGSGGTYALRAGRSFKEDIDELTKRFHLNSSGYFGTSGKGRSHTRIIECSSPIKDAFDFANLAGYSPSSTKTITGKGIIRTMRDGTVISYRFYSKSKDHSPVVELNISNFDAVKSQKIHFVKKGQ